MNLPKRITLLLVVALLLTGCIMPAGSPPVEPEAGHWQTWVVRDVATVRPLAPPNQTGAQAELQAVQLAVAGRDEAALQQIAYWDAGSPSYRWVELTLTHLRTAPVSGPRYLRTIALVNVAIDDAMVATWEAKYTYNRPRPATLDPTLAVLAQHTNSPAYPSEHAAAADAASTILASLFPEAAQSFRDKAQAAAESRVLAGAHFPSDVQAGLDLGRQVAEQVLARAQQDDEVPAWDGVIPTGPGHWSGEKPAEPTAGRWQTWVLASGDELRPGPPFAYDSPEMAAELQEVMDYPRSAESNYRAQYWQSSEGDEIWYNFAALRMFEQGLDGNPPRAARIYALMSVAHYDAVVACWDAKYTYWAIRPFQMEPSLTTVFPTPNHPSYPAGHACVSTAISEVIADQFPAYTEAIRAQATEALESRIAAGIHFRHDIVAGREIGLAVAEKVLERGRQMTQP
jgi:membrane-associated phospholipid phosphatase